MFLPNGLFKGKKEVKVNDFSGFVFRQVGFIDRPLRAALAAAGQSERRRRGVPEPGGQGAESCHGEGDGGGVQFCHLWIQDGGGFTDHWSSG